MVQHKQHCRIDTVELKAMIIQRIGEQRAEMYFNQLKRLFCSKISKSEFDKVCVQIIGRETIALHNQLIRSILNNACSSKAPVFQKTRNSLSVKVVGKNGFPLSYGDKLPSPPRKMRSVVRRFGKSKDRFSPLGPFGKPQNIESEKLLSKTQEQQSPTELFSIGSRPPASSDEGEEVNQLAVSPGIQSKSPVTAPLGVSINFGGAARALSKAPQYENYDLDNCQNIHMLPDTRLLQSSLDRKLEGESMKVSVECANLLNNALDVYLKRLIEPSIGFARSKLSAMKSQQSNSHLPSMSQMGKRLFSPRITNCTLLDFRTAMELNPQVLGVHWTTQLEKISLAER